MSESSAFQFEPDFLRKLERLDWVTRKVLHSQARGEKPKSRVGRSMELFDYRSYQHGDDLRYVDWNIFSRLDQLVVKLFAAEEDISLHVLIDGSASMAIGGPAKFDHARRLGAALAYVGLSRFERVSLHVFSNGDLQSTAPLRGRARMRDVLNFLTGQNAGADTQIDRAIESFAMQAKSPGLVFILSDLIGSGLPKVGLQQLRRRRHDVAVLQLLAEQDIAPALDGDLQLVDSEDGTTLRININQPLRDQYQQQLRARFDTIQKQCMSLGVTYMRASTALSFEDIVVRYMRESRLLK